MSADGPPPAWRAASRPAPLRGGSFEGASDPTADEETPATIGVDIGGTKIRAGWVHGDQVRHSCSVPTPARSGARAILDAVVHLAGSVRDEAAAASGRTAVALGVGSAGVIDSATGRVVSATDHLAGWAGTRVADTLEASLGLPVAVLNDVHAHALGEARHGAGRGLPSVLVVAAGTGLGGAFVLDGQLVLGTHGAAGHLGHVPAAEAAGLRCSCGRTGHLEAVASGPGLLADYQRRGGNASTARQVADRSRSGEPLAASVVERGGRALGQAIGGWIDVFDPDTVVVTGGLAGAGQRWWTALRDAAAGESIDLLRSCPVVAGDCGDDAALIGASTFALDRSWAADGPPPASPPTISARVGVAPASITRSEVRHGA